MFLNTGMAVSEDENKRVLLHLGAARRILDVETWPSVGPVLWKNVNLRMISSQIATSTP